MPSNKPERSTVNSPAGPRRRLSLVKKLLYGSVVCVLFLAVAEGLLAIAGVRSTLADRDPFVGFEGSIPLFVEQLGSQGRVLQTAPNRLAYFNPQQFQARKAAGSYRVFCVGGSTTYGQPYDDSTSYVAWLRELLAVVDDRRQWEVINAGGVSYASYRVANVVDELCRYQPDLLVIYTGHNEFLEERTYRDMDRRETLLRSAWVKLHGTRLFSLMHRLRPQPRTAASHETILPAEVDAILDHAAGPQAYHRDERLRATILEHFEFNLRRMIESARRVGADVMLIKPACNAKDFSPFKSQFASSLDELQQERWIELFLRAQSQEAEGELEAAEASLRAALAIDARRADGHYALGRVLFAQQKFEAAETAWRTAVDEDVCPLRAVPEIQAIVQRVAVAHRVPLIDFDAILQHDARQRLGHAALGNEYFVDHVHPNIETHRLLGLALTEALIQKQVVKPNALWREQAVAEVSRTIEARLEPELQARALTNLAQVLNWADKDAEAGPLAAQAVQLRREHGLADEPESLFYLAVYLETLQSGPQAASLYERVVELVPDNLQARQRLGALLYDQQQWEAAREQFEWLSRHAPANAANWHLLGSALMELEAYAPAVTALSRAVELEPNNAAIQADLKLALQRAAELEPGLASEAEGVQ